MPKLNVKKIRAMAKKAQKHHAQAKKAYGQAKKAQNFFLREPHVKVWFLHEKENGTSG